MKETKLSRKEKQIVEALDKDTLEKILTPKNDLIFKKLFGTVGRENIVKDFLEAILDLKIQSVELGKETILLPEEVDERTGVLDVRATLENGISIDIEMQNAQNYFIAKRAHFYASRMYSSQLKSGSGFKELKKVIVIFITNFDMLKDIPDYHTKWLFTEQQNKEEHFEEMELHFIELPKFLATKYNKRRKIDQWLLFLDYSRKELLKEIMEENKNVKEAEENMEKLKNDEHAQYLAWLREKQILDSNSFRAEGLEMGRAEGLEIGKKEGIEQGIEQEKYETAKRMLNKGIDVKTVCDITELSEEDIEKIKSELEK